MRYLFLLILISGFILPVTFDVSAQDTQSAATHNTRYVRLFLHNGGIYEGEVLEIDESSFLINTLLLGKVRISKTNGVSFDVFAILANADLNLRLQICKIAI